jgi:hypothetical protein
MSTTEHERIEELLAVQALGGLEPGDLAEFDRLRTEHGLDCEVCRRAELEFDEIAGRLAFVFGPVAVPEGMEDALMARALEERPAADAPAPEEPSTAPPTGPDDGRDELAERRARRRPGRTARWVAAIAAVLVLIAGAFAGGFLVRGGGPAGGTQQQQAFAAYLADPNTQVVRFDATNGGNLAVAYRPGDDQSYVFGTDLQPVPSGMQYQLWTFPPGGGPPAPGPTFDPPSAGSPVVVAVPVDVSQAMLMAVTVEQAGGASQPTSTPVFTAPIRTA